MHAVSNAIAVCFFCGSSCHLPQFCNIVVSDDDRKNVLIKKGYCSYCYTAHPVVKECQKNVKCFLCFSRKEHGTLLCPSRFFERVNFIPKIDNILTKRFFQMLDIWEQYTVAFIIEAEILRSTLKPLKVVNEVIYNYSMKTEYGECYVAATNEIHFSNNVYPTQQIQNVNEYVFKNCFFNLKTVIVDGITILFHDFQKLLSLRLQKLECKNVTFSENVMFLDIIKKIPNIKIVEIRDTVLHYQFYWPKMLMENVDRKKFIYLGITLNDPNFCIQSLADFLKKQYVTICLYIPEQIDVNVFNEELFKHFIPASDAPDSVLIIHEEVNSYVKNAVVSKFVPL